MNAAILRGATTSRRGAGWRRARRVGILGLALLTVAAGAGAGRAGAVALRIDEGDGGRYQVEGRFAVTASPATTWRVLTDYDGLSRFVSSMEKSAVDTSGGGLRVEQEAVVRYLFFSRRMRVVLDVREDSLRAIRFVDTSGEHFAHYAGAWRLVDGLKGVEVVYQLDALPRTAFPRFIQRRMLNRTVEQLLTQVRDEIERVASR